jgi:hypothetical protein
MLDTSMSIEQQRLRNIGVLIAFCPSTVDLDAPRSAENPLDKILATSHFVSLSWHRRKTVLKFFKPRTEGSFSRR